AHASGRSLPAFLKRTEKEWLAYVRRQEGRRDYHAFRVDDRGVPSASQILFGKRRRQVFRIAGQDQQTRGLALGEDRQDGVEDPFVRRLPIEDVRYRRAVGLESARSRFRVRCGA